MESSIKKIRSHNNSKQLFFNTGYQPVIQKKNKKGKSKAPVPLNFFRPKLLVDTSFKLSLLQRVQ